MAKIWPWHKAEGGKGFFLAVHGADFQKSDSDFIRAPIDAAPVAFGYFLLHHPIAQAHFLDEELIAGREQLIKTKMDY